MLIDDRDGWRDAEQVAAAREEPTRPVMLRERTRAGRLQYILDAVSEGKITQEAGRAMIEAADAYDNGKALNEGPFDDKPAMEMGPHRTPEQVATMSAAAAEQYGNAKPLADVLLTGNEAHHYRALRAAAKAAHQAQSEAAAAGHALRDALAALCKAMTS